MDGKTKAIVSHITFVGLIVAIFMNHRDKDEYASFYIRQQLGLLLIAICYAIPVAIITFILGLIPFLGALFIFLFMCLSSLFSSIWVVFWILSLIRADADKQEPLPFIGNYFQDWFKAL